MTTLSYREEYDAIQAFHRDNPTFVSFEDFWDMWSAVMISFFAVSGFFASSIGLVGCFVKNKSDYTFIYKIAYQVTNLMVNAALSVMGLYFFNYSIDKTPKTLEEQVLQHYPKMHWLSAAQLGYNFWAIPTGLTFVKESNAMLGHHAAVIIVSLMSGFFVVGFQYFTPFMYGVLEISSVPLAVMNGFKENKEYFKAYPKTGLNIRLIFCFTFLYIRWYLYLPIKYDFLRLHLFATLTFDEWYFVAYYVLVWLASFFLLLLQIFWGVLIVKGLWKAAGFGKKKQNKDGKSKKVE